MDFLSRCRRLTGIGLGLALLAGPLAGADKPSDTPGTKPATLQVQMNLPASWEPMFDDDIARAFVSRIRSVFRQKGYEGEIELVTAFDEPEPGCCLLTVNLLEWRARPVGDTIECTFTANLQTGTTIRNLGVFTDMAFRWMHSPGRLGLADTFGRAAEGAIGQLYGDLRETELIPAIASQSE